MIILFQFVLVLFVKPLIYVRSKPKDYGTSKSIEGKIWEGLKAVMIDDIATAGGAVVNGIKSLTEAKIKVEDAYVIVNRMEGAVEALKEQGVTLHSITNVMQITKSLHEQNLVGDNVLQKVQEQIGIK